MTKLVTLVLSRFQPMSREHKSESGKPQMGTERGDEEGKGGGRKLRSIEGREGQIAKPLREKRMWLKIKYGEEIWREGDGRRKTAA